MPELVEQLFCSQQIIIPPKFPYILKRFAKAAIKTQPYDLLRWAFEYFEALAEHRPPPVKLRLEYPVYSTEGGLTRGYLKVLAHQLEGFEDDVPVRRINAIWSGACLDMLELQRILCLCEVYMRNDFVPRLNFIAVAGGLLTKNLTHTMILLCETLTKEPDGGSAAIPVEDFLNMYEFLADIDASRDIKYTNGYREGEEPPPEIEEEVEEEEIIEPPPPQKSVDSFWGDNYVEIVPIALIDDNYTKTTRISDKMNAPLIGELSRSPSVERDAMIEREEFLLTRHARLMKKIDTENLEKRTEEAEAAASAAKPGEAKPAPDKEEDKTVRIYVFDEEEKPVELEFFGEPEELPAPEEQSPNEEGLYQEPQMVLEEQVPEKEEKKDPIAEYVEEWYKVREERQADLQRTFDELNGFVERFKTAHYDLGMVAGRQMSTTSAEFVVEYIEKEIMDYINDQIAILPDPDLKKKKAKPWEVEMIRELLRQYLDENMDVICPDLEVVEEEEEPIPDIVIVYAVPGIGPRVSDDIRWEFKDYLLESVKVQNQLAMPRNIRHFMCPPLEEMNLVSEVYKESSTEKVENEEVVVTGRILME